MDKASRDRLAKVHPVLRERVEKLIASITSKDIRVVQGLRSYAEQNALYAQGRTKPGQKVTKAKGGFSNHNFGLAVDLCPFEDGKADWDDNAGFSLIGKAAKAVGLEWGGDWESFPDRPHVQLSGMTTEECRKLSVGGDLTKVWARMDTILGVRPAPKKSATPINDGTQNPSAVKLHATNISQNPHETPDTLPINSEGPPTETTQITETSGGATVETAKNEQNVNETVQQEGPTPYQGIGFWAVIKRDIAAVFGGNLTFEGLSQYAQKATEWPEWVVALIGKLAVFAIVGGAAYLVFRVVHYIVDTYKKGNKTKTEAMINTDITRKNIEFTEPTK